MITQALSASGVQRGIGVISGPCSGFGRRGRPRHGLGLMVKGVQSFDLATARGGLQGAGGGLGLGLIRAALNSFKAARLQVQRIPPHPKSSPNDQEQNYDDAERRQPAQRRQGAKNAAAHG
jgi:hypothetical protein